jgi:hypothetical protein
LSAHPIPTPRPVRAPSAGRRLAWQDRLAWRAVPAASHANRTAGRKTDRSGPVRVCSNRFGDR